MSISIYFISGLITALWSFWLFIVWEKKAGLKDTSLLRFLLMLLPVSYYILITFSDWSSIIFLRVDIMGLVCISLAALFFWLIQLGTLFFRQEVYRQIFLITVMFNQAITLSLVVFTFVLKSYPLVAVRLSTFLESWQQVDLLKVLWEGLDPEKNQATMLDLFNKIIIALGIYIPMTAVRIWYTDRKFKQLKQEIDNLQRCVDQMQSEDISITDVDDFFDNRHF